MNSTGSSRSPVTTLRMKSLSRNSRMPIKRVTEVPGCSPCSEPDAKAHGALEVPVEARGDERNAYCGGGFEEELQGLADWPDLQPDGNPSADADIEGGEIRRRVCADSHVPV